MIVPCSGGKDGGFVAHQLKYKYGMNPLTVTWAPLKATDIGRRNLDAFIQSGFDNVLGTPNGKITRKLTRSRRSTWAIHSSRSSTARRTTRCTWLSSTTSR